MDYKEIQKRWKQHQMSQQKIKAQRHYKNVEELWEKYSSYKIEYEEFEDALLGMETLRKITAEQLKKYQNKAKEFMKKGDTEFEKEFNPEKEYHQIKADRLKFKSSKKLLKKGKKQVIKQLKKEK